jgi:hypothetical protein
MSLECGDFARNMWLPPDTQAATREEKRWQRLVNSFFTATGAMLHV